MAFSIVAELPLGVFRGHARDGSPERLPSVARLHSALLCAAGIGPRAVPGESGGLGPSEVDDAALRWLEEHPPDGVHIPALEVNRSPALAYRDDGTISRLKVNKLPKPHVGGTAVGGAFVWSWNDTPPPEVRAAFEALCPDVGYLGTTESPVRMCAVDSAIDTALVLDPEAGLFSTGSTTLERPLPGRAAELDANFRTTQGTAPSVSRDKVKTDEASLSEVPPREAVGVARYREREDATDPRVPWTQVVVLPLGLADNEVEHRPLVNERLRVAWAVALHRALIRLIGDGAPPLITGAYADPGRRPANRVAIHVINDTMPFARPLGVRSAFGLMVPRDADPVDTSVLYAAIAGLRSVRGPGGRVVPILQDRIEVLAGDRVWAPPADGMRRLWRTMPVAVPESRGGSSAHGETWGFAHAALLSIGFVFKPLLGRVEGRGIAHHRALARAASERRAVAVHVSAMRDSNVGDFVHRVSEHAVVRPYRAVVSLGDLAGSGTCVAIGQSRHLGGGLLVPFDVVDDGTASAAAGEER